MTFGDDDRIGTVMVGGKSADVIVSDMAEATAIQVIPMRDLEEDVPYLVAIPRTLYDEIEQHGRLEWLQLALTELLTQLLLED